MGETIKLLRERLSSAYPTGEVEAFIRIIFHRLLGYETVDLLLKKENRLPSFISEKVQQIIRQLLDKRPIQYIFGKADFCGHTFSVDGSTLIPRPETEELVDRIIDENPTADLQILDAGTGSGCIAISLALAMRFPEVCAIDISEAALAVAKANAASLRANVRFQKANMLHLPYDTDRWDIIVSNPPYITLSEMASMDGNVTRNEPHEALFVDDSDPLKFYRVLSEYGSTALKPGGRIYFEINSRFPDEMRKLLRQTGYIHIDISRDMQGRYRFASAQKDI